MPSRLDQATHALDDAIAASRQTHRQNLLRIVRRQRVRIHVVFVLTACMALAALGVFVSGDREAGLIISLMTCWTLGFALLAWKIGRKSALELLREVNRPM